ncbi:hypothetical protein DL96DRAFT_1631742 [Flagelloscypha sp. PMI_526]|nr:hypothetical protein DL96DRAFT_1631742 [Flagelloscypha sp. PMI_526]
MLLHPLGHIHYHQIILLTLLQLDLLVCPPLTQPKKWKETRGLKPVSFSSALSFDALIGQPVSFTGCGTSVTILTKTVKTRMGIELVEYQTKGKQSSQRRDMLLLSRLFLIFAKVF